MLWSRSRPQERLRFQWMFIWMIPPQLPNLLTPNFVWWCIIMGQNVTQADWFAVFKFKVTARAHLIRYDCFCHVSWTADLLATKVNWMVHHHKLEWFVYKLDICFQGQGHSESSELYWIFMYHIFCTTDLWQPKKVCLFTIHNITKPSTTKWAYTDSST